MQSKTALLVEGADESLHLWLVEEDTTLPHEFTIVGLWRGGVRNMVMGQGKGEDSGEHSVPDGVS